MEVFFVIKVIGTPLYLHKSSNMFTTDFNQCRKYKTMNHAYNWIASRKVENDYNKKFSGMNFQVSYIREGVE